MDVYLQGQLFKMRDGRTFPVQKDFSYSEYVRQAREAKSNGDYPTETVLEIAITLMQIDQVIPT